ncbi:adenylate/guanylate cyclase domain-containing protein [Planococcus sp. CPCC 101016]|uniref:adenylate/guanylate cyclase domain-containing protein n=1 Tax=Planococcus sp. CPCC 101016 TaxID=2599617 RepID=UPI0011B36EA6|nr:adenylate/guanylate cyclase domain-containing protein [Planococcus sp. CPCC 101016]TWT04490.1 adenylate/guanylate cyclase domain-containing protein [Planococcus sp. CPCC 101016]
MKPKTYVLEKEYAVDRKTAWQLLADNNRMNLYIGLFPVSFSPAKQDGVEVFYREAHAKVLGLVPISWQEFPFQWQENDSYTVERRYLTGPLKRYTLKVELFDSAQNGTRVKLTADFVPLNPLGYGAIWATGLPAVKKIMRYLDDYLASEATNVLEAPQRPKAVEINLLELDRLSALLAKSPVENHYVEQLHDYLVGKGDHDVAQIEPVNLARMWNTDLDETLRVLLYATKAGLLNLSWNVICPNCRVSKVEHSSLSQLEQAFHCDLCGVNYDANFDQFVELNFSVHPAIRKAYAEVYCIGGPMITPHVKAQQVIERGKTASFRIPQGEEALRFRVLQANDRVTVDKSAEATQLLYSDLGWSQDSVSNTGEVVIKNSSSADVVVALEHSDWNKQAVTAAKVTVMQEFRDLFSSEVLSPDQKIGIDHVTILFTDLKGSTLLYETIGDSSAYGQVRNHFDFLTGHIVKNSGSVVKTIGDAVMAVFHKPEDGLKAALAIQKNLQAFNDTANEELVLRLGVYSGAAIAVNSNDRLDYFGRTVNIAARIEGQGEGNDVVISRELLAHTSSVELLSAADVELEEFSAVLKGIEGAVDLVRIRLKENVLIEKHAG